MHNRKRTAQTAIGNYELTSVLLESNLTVVSESTDTLTETVHKHLIEIRSLINGKHASIYVLSTKETFSSSWLETEFMFIITHAMTTVDGFADFCEWFLKGENYSTSKALQLFNRYSYYLKQLLPVIGSIQECDAVIDLLFEDKTFELM